MALSPKIMGNDASPICIFGFNLRVQGALLDDIISANPAMSKYQISEVKLGWVFADQELTGAWHEKNEKT